MKKANPAVVLQNKRALLSSTIKGRTSASSSSLAASYALPVEDVQRILHSMGVRDDD